MLRDAFRQVRERHEGAHPESDVTLRRVLLATRKRAKTRSITRFVLLPIAATLVASTVWAGVTGRLHGALHTFDAVHTERTEPAPVVAPAPSSVATPLPSSTAVEAPAEVPPEVPVPAPVAPPAPIVVAPSSAALPAPPAAPAPPPPPASASAPADANAALFAEAHRVHFVDKDSARALAAWDAYLRAAPSGRFVPEARYNRALTLVRLGRTSEATTDLRAFASGTYGEYRREEAKALLEALERDGATSPTTTPAP